MTVDPTTGDVRTNGPPNTTVVAVSATTSSGLVVSASLARIKVGDHITVRERLDASRWWAATVMATPTDNTSWWSIPVAMLDQSATGQPNNNREVLITIRRFNTQTFGMVQDLTVSPEDGTHLLIPRIEPTEVTELETDFPDLSEDERIHDGLWVRAVGGLGEHMSHPVVA